MTDAPTRRPGGRSALVVVAVRRAVEELVAELGPERVTVGQVAERSGVAATTIYRRWGDLPTLVNEVAAYRLDPDRPLPDTGDTGRDILEWSRELAEHFGVPSNAALLRAGAALAGDGVSDCTARRREEADLLVARGRDRGERGIPSVDRVIDGLVAPIVYRAIFIGRPLTPDEMEPLVDVLLDR